MSADRDAVRSRRDFLARAAAASFFVVTPRRLFAEEQAGAASRPASSPATPPALGGSRSFAEFLAKARASGKPAIVLRVPDRAGVRDEFLQVLSNALGDRPWLRTLTLQAAELFCDSVIACGSRDTCRALVPEWTEAEDALLLDADGRRIDGAALEPKTLLDAAT